MAHLLRPKDRMWVLEERGNMWGMKKGDSCGMIPRFHALQTGIFMDSTLHLHNWESLILFYWQLLKCYKSHQRTSCSFMNITYNDNACTVCKTYKSV